MEDDYDGNKYPKLFYMEAIADKFYPGWSIDLIEQKQVATVDGQIVYITASVKLSWHESHYGENIYRTGVQSDAEMVQYKKDSDRNNLNNIVNLGNHYKGSITRAIKKAMATYLNICGDVYFAQTPFIPQDELERFKDRVINSERAKSDSEIDKKIVSSVLKEIDMHSEFKSPNSLKMNRDKMKSLFQQFK